MVKAEVPALAEVRGDIIKTVGDLLKSMGEGSTAVRPQTAVDEMVAAIQHSYGRKVAITVVRADEEICAATVRFEGKVGDSFGDRESVRFRRNNGVWEKDGRRDMYSTSLFPSFWP